MKKFLAHIGLSGVSALPESTHSITENILSKELPQLSAEQIRELYQYPVPKLSPDGSCSISEEAEEAPFDLRNILQITTEFENLHSHPHTARLWRLQQMISELQAETSVDWLGIYRKIKKSDGTEVLIKEAYYGAMSRAEFPLTKAFAAKSNNSTVGLNGKAIVVDSVAEYAGPYYECDGKVQSEFCLPILDAENVVIGIIDAESFQEQFFNAERIWQIARVAHDLGKHHLLLS